MTVDHSEVRGALHSWGMIQGKIDKLLEEQKPFTELIERLTLEAGVDIPLGYWGVTAKWSAGRGRYDWRAIGGVLEHDRNLSATVIDKHSKVTINWRAACAEVGYPDALAQEHYAPGTPSVRIKLLDDGDS